MPRPQPVSNIDTWISLLHFSMLVLVICVGVWGLFHQGFKGTAQMATVGMSSTCESSDDVDHIPLLVDNGASGHYFDDDRQLSLRDKLLHYKELEKPHNDRHCRITGSTRNSYRHGLWGDHRRERKQTTSVPSGNSRTWSGASSVLSITGS